jgi:AraC-like DNA-binding protein
MPSCATYATREVDEYAAALRPSEGEVTVTGRGGFHATVVRVSLHRLWMQSAQETLARTWNAELWADRGSVSFLTRPGLAIHQGVEARADEISLKASGQPVWQRLGPSAHWGTMSLPTEDWAETASVIAGRDIVPRGRSILIAPRAAPLATLRRLHAATADLARSAPEMIEDPEVARGLEQGLLRALVACVDTVGPREATMAQRNHTNIITRFRRALEERSETAVYVPEICAAIGVSDRTLRLCCREQLGVSPGRYLYLRRMTLVRRALRLAKPGATSVTRIAARFGFWELGRFAVDYRSLFHESPSVTLRHSDA